MPLCPDVVFLFASVESARNDQVPTYLRNGAALVAVLDVAERLVEMHRPRGVDRIPNVRDVNVTELSNFAIESAKLFA